MVFQHQRWNLGRKSVLERECNRGWWCGQSLECERQHLRVEEIAEQTGEVVGRLCGDVIEVDAVPNDVQHWGINWVSNMAAARQEMESLTCEEERQESNVLVHGDGAVKGNVLVQESLPQVRDRVTAHRDKETAVSEHHSAGCPTGHGHSVSSNASQSAMFPLHRIICKKKCSLRLVLTPWIRVKSCELKTL